MSIESRRYQYGKVFGHWQIKGFLGSGSGGKTAVFRLEHIESVGVESALKVVSLIEERGNIDNLPPERRQEYEKAREDCSKIAEREILLMNQLQGNTNIVDYLDHTFVDWSDETGFGRDMLIRMEKLTDLRAQIKDGKQFSRKEVLKIGRDISTALTLCHTKGILHRDIKPENIFVNKDGNYKLGDFGISRIVTTASTVLASTGIGTPQYWAPEQTSGSYDTRVDIYSLGLVLYELSNRNHLPFAESSYIRESEIHRRLLGEALPAPYGADPALAQLILKACAHNAADRYQTAEELLYAIQKLNGSIMVDYNATIPAQDTLHADAYSTLSPHTAGQSDSYDTLPAQHYAPQQNHRKAPALNGIPCHPLSSVSDLVYTVRKRTERSRHWVWPLSAGTLALIVLCFFLLSKGDSSNKSDDTFYENTDSTAQSTIQQTDHVHTWIAETCANPRICSECGETFGKPLEHQWIDATYSAPKYCILCGISEGYSLGYPLTWCKEIANSNNPDAKHSTDVAIGTWSDNDGNIYSNAIKFWVTSSMVNSEYITYGINSDYSEMALTIVAADNNANGGRSRITVYIDQNLTYQSDWVDNTTGVIEVKLNITDAETVMIKCDTDSALQCYCIVNALLYVTN